MEEKINVLHKIQFESNIDMEDDVIMNHIMRILIKNDYNNIKHSISFDKKQKPLMKFNNRFKDYCERMKRYIRKC